MRNFTKYLFLLLLAGVISCHKDNSSPSNGIVPNDFLSGNKYNKLVVEIQYVNGYAPTSATVSNFQAFLEQRLNKPSGITIVQKAIPSPGKTTYSLADIQQVESANRTQITAGVTLTAYFFFADGDYAANSGNAKVLGVSYGSSSMVIFEKTIQGLAGGLSQPPLSTLETTVLDHEFGHILGLVNNGTPMQTAHQDAAHGRHCNNQDCLMYYSVETSDLTANIIGGNIPAPDANCLADLKANGGK